MKTKKPKTAPVPNAVKAKRQANADKGKADNNGIHYALVGLSPRKWRILELTDEWFERSPNTLSVAFAAATRLNPENGAKTLRRLHDQDNAQSKKRIEAGVEVKKPISWRQNVGQRLIVIDAVRRRMADRLFHIGRVTNDEGYRVPFPMAWMIRNCPPAGAIWDATKHFNDPTGKNPTGYTCHSAACPWCWMRQNRFLRKLICLPNQYLIQPPRQSGKRKPALGWKSGVSVWKIDTYVKGLFENDGAAITAFRVQAEYAFNHEHGRPLLTVKTLAPIWDKYRGFGVRIAYIYSGVTHIESPNEVATNVDVEQALLIAQPYCLQFLESDQGAQEIVNVLGGLHRKHTFEVVKFRSQRKSKIILPVPQFESAPAAVEPQAISTPLMELAHAAQPDPLANRIST